MKDKLPAPSVTMACPFVPSAVGQFNPSSTMLPPVGLIVMFPESVVTANDDVELTVGVPDPDVVKLPAVTVSVDAL